ncbi:hypothetical protein BH23ACT9_BH23ACT9_02280 [soil metagenome]
MPSLPPPRPALTRTPLTVIALVVALAAALLLSTPAVGPAQAQLPTLPGLPGGDEEPVDESPLSYTVTAGVLETTTGPADAEIPVSLDYDLYVPESATAQTPQPAMVVAHGFGNSKAVNEVVALAALFAGEGYVVLTSSHQGFGGSSGCIALDSVDYDGRNVASLIDVLAARPDVLKDAAGDPVVGMVGGSYGGGHQAGVASIDRRLDAMSPGRTWNSLQYSLVPNNLVTSGMWDLDAYEQGVFKVGWTSLFFASGQTQPAMGNGGCDPITQQTLFPGQPPCAGYLPQICPLYARLLTTGDSTEPERALVRRSAAAAFLDQVDIPVLLTQGQSDTLFTPTEALATFEGLRARGIDASILLNDGGHGYAPQPGEGEPYAGGFDATPESQVEFARTTFARRYLAFFGHHLRGGGDPGPRVSWFRDWVDYDPAVGNADAAYANAEDHPVGGVLAYVLDAETDELRPATTSSVSMPVASATIINPPVGLPAAHSETPNFTGPGQPGALIPPSEVPGQHVAFTGPSLEQPLESVGVGTVRVHLANANSQDAVLFAKLYDVDADGSATLIRRLVTAVRVPAESLPGHVLIRLPGIVHRFEAGHSVRLVLSTTDDSYRNSPVPDQLTITTEGTQAVMLLPALGEAQLLRLAGPNRVDTAVQVSMEAFPDGAPAVVLAAGGDFPDALAAGGLAAAAEGPLLLTDTASLSPRVLTELRRLSPSTVYIAGGVAAVGAAVESALVEAGFTVERVAGADRFATAAALAGRTADLRGGVDRVVLARGDTFVDALAAGSLSATGAPVLLVGEGVVPEATAAALGSLSVDEVYLAGGVSAISESVAAAVEAPGRTVTRLGGATRYETAEALFEEARRSKPSSQTLLLASGERFPDALAAAPAAHALGGLLMITDPEDIQASPPAARIVAGDWTTVYLVGGYAALGQAIDGQVAALLGSAATG